MTSRLCVVALLLMSTLSWASVEEQKLLTKLFENYDTRVRPVQKDSDTLLVKVGLMLRKLIKLCPKSNTFEVLAWISQRWTDHQLKWSPAQNGGITKLFVPQSDIFKPDLVLYNSAKEMHEDHKLQPNQALILPDGTVLVVDSVKLVANCHTNTTQIEANCSIKLGSWVYDMSRIDLTMGDFNMDLDGVPNKYWSIQGINATRGEIVIPKYPESYVYININVNMTKNLDMNDEWLEHHKKDHH